MEEEQRIEALFEQPESSSQLDASHQRLKELEKKANLTESPPAQIRKGKQFIVDTMSNLLFLFSSA